MAALLTTNTRPTAFRLGDGSRTTEGSDSTATLAKPPRPLLLRIFHLRATICVLLSNYSRVSFHSSFLRSFFTFVQTVSEQITTVSGTDKV